MTNHKPYYFTLTFIFLFITFFGYSQAPEGINYQAVLRKSNGSLWSNYEFNSIVEIVQGNISGPPVYSEKHYSITNGQGIVNYVIGDGLTLMGDFESIDWGLGPYYLKLNIDFLNGEGLQLYGIQQLLSVPYALHAKVADSIAGGSGSTQVQGHLEVQDLADQGNSGTEQDGSSSTGEMDRLEHRW